MWCYQLNTDRPKSCSDFKLHVNYHSIWATLFNNGFVSRANPSAAQAYELTSGAGGGCGDTAGALANHAPQPPLSLNTHSPPDPRKKKGSHL